MHVIAGSLHRLRGTDNLRFNNEKMGYLLDILSGPDRINVDYMSHNRINVDYIRVAIELRSIILEPQYN